MDTTTATLSLRLFLAETAEGRMPGRGEVPDTFRPAGDPLEVELDTTLDLAVAIATALEVAYAEANVGTPDGRHGAWVESYRMRDRARSLSVGDAVVVNGEVGYVVDGFGFRPMTADELEVLARAAR